MNKSFARAHTPHTPQDGAERRLGRGSCVCAKAVYRVIELVRAVDAAVDAFDEKHPFPPGEPVHIGELCEAIGGSDYEPAREAGAALEHFIAELGIDAGRQILALRAVGRGDLYPDDWQDAAKVFVRYETADAIAYEVLCNPDSAQDLERGYVAVFPSARQLQLLRT